MARFRAPTVVRGHRSTQVGRQRSITKRVTGTSRLWWVFCSPYFVSTF